jgi:hypothetical protein
MYLVFLYNFCSEHFPLLHNAYLVTCARDGRYCCPNFNQKVECINIFCQIPHIKCLKNNQFRWSRVASCVDRRRNRYRRARRLVYSYVTVRFKRKKIIDILVLKHHGMKPYGVAVQLHVFLTLAQKVVSYTLWPFALPYPSNRRLGGFQVRSGSDSERKPPTSGNWTPVVHPQLSILFFFQELSYYLHLTKYAGGRICYKNKKKAKEIIAAYATNKTTPNITLWSW